VCRPCWPFRTLGAMLFTYMSFDSFFRLNGECATTSHVDRRAEDATVVVDNLLRPFADRYGPTVWSEAATGFQMCARAQEQADADLHRQLLWLSGIDDFCRLATDIQSKIDSEHIPINRETFVEPREMCSTTHVHDDHRLVVVETGEMVFWGMPGMRLCLKPGEMALVPRHRLHGSSVLTNRCVYHQPIIPQKWLADYLRDSVYNGVLD
jgi:hypothetical protein